jgi:hypothetical protein
MKKFKELWKSYRGVIVVVLAVSGVGAPVATGILATGDAVSQIETEEVGT